MAQEHQSEFERKMYFEERQVNALVKILGKIINIFQTVSDLQLLKIQCSHTLSKIN